MNYEVLQAMALDTLMDMLARNTTDLLKAIEKKDRQTTMDLQKKVELLQEIISQKKSHPDNV